MMSDDYRVTATALNLRNTPGTTGSNRIATLPEGTTVTKLEESELRPWWRIRTSLNGIDVEGYVHSGHLGPATASERRVRRVQEVHLAEGRQDITRRNANGRAFPIGEAGRPAKLSGNATNRKNGLIAIIDWLDVERGARWKPTSSSTFCNIYAYDVCYLAGAYMPRVWWTHDALSRLERGEQVAPRYDATVRELNANALTNWFEDHGATFGWKRHFDAGELQEAANKGHLAVIVAQRTDLNRSGHIQMVAPETSAHQARRDGSRVNLPLQSQAGTRNFCYGFLGNSKWWTNPSQFRKHGFWVSSI
jgi:hypothetical protein